MTKAELVEFLKTVPLFEGLSTRELRAVAALGKEVSYPAGKMIVKEGESGVGLHLIISGKAKVTKRGSTVSTVGPGKYFGEISLIDKGPRTATVAAETDVLTLSLSAWAFNPLLTKHPAITKKLLLELCRRVRELDKSPTH